MRKEYLKHIDFKEQDNEKTKKFINALANTYNSNPEKYENNEIIKRIKKRIKTDK